MNKNGKDKKNLKKGLILFGNLIQDFSLLLDFKTKV